jgi:sulfonate transport system permease protein
MSSAGTTEGVAVSTYSRETPTVGADPPGSRGALATVGAGRPSGGAATSVNSAPDVAARPDGTRRDGASRRGWARVISPVVAVGLWQLASSTGILPASKLASPASVARTAYQLITTNNPAYGTLQHSLLISLERWGIGFSLGVAIAVLLALVTGLSRIGEYALDPLAQAVRSVPLFGVLPLFIIWFGIGELPKILIVLLGALFPMYVNTWAGIRGVDSRFGEVGQVLGLSRREMVRHIVLPGALPLALAGLRLAAVGSLLALVVGEQINASAGLGFMITQAEQFLQNNIITVALVVYAILGLIADALVMLLQRRVLAWRRDFVQ